MIKPEGNRSY